MPFKSEKQRRYLWANEPEITRDWTDTYGHKARGADGGVMRVPFQLGGDFPYARQQMTMPQNYSNLPFQGARTIDRYKDVDPYRMNYLNRDLPNTYLSQSMLPGSKWSMEQNPLSEYTSDPEYNDDPYGFDRMNEEKGVGGYKDVYNQGQKFGEADTFQEYFANNPQFLKGIKENLGRGIDKTKQGLGELWQRGKEKAGGIFEKGKEYGIQGKDLLMAGLGAATGVPLGLMNLMRKGIRPDTEYETYQKQMMGVDPTGSRAGKDPWGQNIRSLKGGYDVEDQWKQLQESALGQKYNYAGLDPSMTDEEYNDWLSAAQDKGYKGGWQLQRALGLSKYGGKAAAWKKKRQIAGQKQETDRMRRIQETEAAQKRAAQQRELQAQVTSQANREARERVDRGEARDYGKTETRASSGWESSPFYKGGRVSLSQGGLASLWT